jgi:surfeit locus 1 family protein
MRASGARAGRVRRLVGWGAVLIGLAVTLGLGVWQLQRLQWKQELISRMQERLARPALPLPATMADLAAWDYARVTIEGALLHERGACLAPRIIKDAQGRAHLGAHLLVPLMPTDGGDAVLIDRGWIPLERCNPLTRPADTAERMVRIEGIARRPAPRGWMQPDNRPEAGTWYWIDLPALAQAADIAALHPLFIEAGGLAEGMAIPGKGERPIPGQTITTIKNDHLAYALTWFGLAATLAALCAIRARTR